MNRKIVMICFIFCLMVFGLLSTSVYANGYLLVKIKPKPSQVSVCDPDEDGNKAYWRVDGGSWKDCDDDLAELPEGQHAVDFKEVPGWATPASTTVNITTDATTTVTEYYEKIEYHYYYSDIANTYFVASGFDTNGDGQPDVVDTGATKLFAVELPGQPGVYLQSYIGGMTAPLAYYPHVERDLTDEGLGILIGDKTFEQPQDGSALEFRTKLYATSGINGLKAFYADAITAFTPQLLRILEAEERFREALRVNPYFEDALNGLLECYYARAEGFTLIGNDYLAKAYKHKFYPKPNEQSPIVELEVGDISSALICYETGFREFMKLFNPEFIGLGDERKQHLDINAEWMFFDRRFTNPNNPGGDKISYESLRGQKNAIGVSSGAFNNANESIGTVQGSPHVEIEIPVKTSPMSPELLATGKRKKSLSEKRLSILQAQLNTIDAPVKIQLPTILGAPTYLANSDFVLRFDVDIKPDNPIKKLQMAIEFDDGILDVKKVDFSDSAFPNNTQYVMPGGTYGNIKLFANQLLVIGESGSPVSGEGRKFVKVTFHIKTGATGEFFVYAAGSAGSLLSGYKDVAILYRLAAAHAYATAEKIKRLYNTGDQKSMEDSIALIEEEVGRIGGWFEHIQALLAQSAKPEELASIDQLQSAINQVSSELNGLSNLREFIRSGANVYGYRDDYVPFYNNSGQVETFDAIRNLVVGSGAFTPKTAGGYFGTAREAETTAVLTKEKFEDTKDRIRSEIFTFNEQMESRLVQICGRVDKDGKPSVNVNDDIDYDLRAAPKNIACEIGQHVLLLQRANDVVEQAQADIVQFLEDIEYDKEALEKEIALKNDIPGIIDEYSQLQQNLTREITKVQIDQIRANAVTQAATTCLAASNAEGWITGQGYGAGIAAAVQLANGIYQGELERKKGELQAQKEGVAAQERIRLTEIDTEIFKIEYTKNIEQKLNDVVLKDITVQIAAIDMQVALGQLNQLIAERDELLAKRGRQLANLGEMSFADPSFRLTQFNAMKDAETQIEFLKGWLYLMTRALYYKWALPEDMKINVTNLPQINIHDINRIQVVGVLDNGIDGTPLGDTITASDYVLALLAFNDSFPINNAPSLKKIDSLSDKTARYSIREDFLRIVRTAKTDQEKKRVHDAFTAWLKSSDRRNAAGDLVIEFDTIGNLEDYDIVVDKNHGTWTNFALRSYSTKPLWNHKITGVGVALEADGTVFNGVNLVHASIEYGGAGFVKSDKLVGGNYLVFQMKQWVRPPDGGLEPIDVRTVDVDIVPSGSFTKDKMSLDLKERPVTATLWRLIILNGNVNKINLDNIVDIFVYIDSEAYQGQ